jgi:hypothetical protein
MKDCREESFARASSKDGGRDGMRIANGHKDEKGGTDDEGEGMAWGEARGGRRGKGWEEEWGRDGMWVE